MSEEMGITEDLVLNLLEQCYIGDHPQLSTWEVEQLARAWLNYQSLRKECDALRAQLLEADYIRLERELSALRAWQTKAVEDLKDLYVELDTLRAQLAQAQNETLERAAKKCDDLSKHDEAYNPCFSASDCAKEIRAMKSPNSA